MEKGCPEKWLHHHPWKCLRHVDAVLRDMVQWWT